MLLAILEFCIQQPRYTHEKWGKMHIIIWRNRRETTWDKYYRIILKWIRKIGSGDVTGLNCLHLQASLVTFMWIRRCNKTYWKAHMRGYVSYQLPRLRIVAWTERGTGVDKYLWGWWWRLLPPPSLLGVNVRRSIGILPQHIVTSQHRKPRLETSNIII
jgi:hypothetical protein